MSALHFGDMTQPIELVFLHANGFNAQSYRTIFEKLPIHSVVFDMRGHGRSQDLPTDIEALNNWHIFRDDLCEFARENISGTFILSGHSFGAVSAMLAVSQLKDQLSGFIAFDPVTMPFYVRWVSGFRVWRESFKKRVPIARNAGRRKSIFDSPEDAFARYHNRGAFRGVSDAIIKDYLEGGLIEKDGTYHLACYPAWEQAIFAAQNHNLFATASDLPDNSHIIYAGKKGAVSTPGTRAKLKRLQPNIKIDFRKDLAHLFPLHDPDLAVQTIKHVLDNR